MFYNILFGIICFEDVKLADTCFYNFIVNCTSKIRRNSRSLKCPRCTKLYLSFHNLNVSNGIDIFKFFTLKNFTIKSFDIIIAFLIYRCFINIILFLFFFLLKLFIFIKIINANIYKSKLKIFKYLIELTFDLMFYNVAF